MQSLETMFRKRIIKSMDETSIDKAAFINMHGAVYGIAVCQFWKIVQVCANNQTIPRLDGLETTIYS